MKNFKYIVGHVVHKLYSKFKFSKNKDCVYSKQCLSILLCCKIDSDDTQALINTKDRGGLWRVNETVQNIFIEFEKIFRSFTSAFRLGATRISILTARYVIWHLGGGGGEEEVVKWWEDCDVLCYIENKINKVKLFFSSVLLEF